MVVLVQLVVLSGSWFDRVGVGRNLLVVFVPEEAHVVCLCS